MSVRSLALFVHLLGFASLFFALGTIQRAGARVKSATSVEEMRVWLGFARTTRRTFPVAFLLILLSGLYMAGTSFSFETPWIVVSIVSLFVMGALGQGVVGRGFAAMGKAAGSATSVSGDLARVVAKPAPWVALGALNGLVIGVVWLMVDKPGWGESVGVVVLLAVLGAGAAVVAARRPSPS